MFENEGQKRNMHGFGAKNVLHEKCAVQSMWLHEKCAVRSTLMHEKGAVRSMAAWEMCGSKHYLEHLDYSASKSYCRGVTLSIYVLDHVYAN